MFQASDAKYLKADATNIGSELSDFFPFHWHRLFDLKEKKKSMTVVKEKMSCKPELLNAYGKFSGKAIFSFNCENIAPSLCGI